jgi:hypothetical protein
MSAAGESGNGENFSLNRVDNPQSGGKPYKNDYQRLRTLAAWAQSAKNPISRPGTDTGKRNREDLIIASSDS